MSKTHQKLYYLHEPTGRRQWEPPNGDIERDRETIRQFYKSLVTTLPATPKPTERERWRCFNNFLKQSIMYEFSKDLGAGFSVLDVGCGTGGDVNKWARLGASRYVGFDACSQGVEKLKSRKTSLPVQAYAADFTQPECWESLKSQKFQIISCQFAAHYAFAEKRTIQTFLRGLSHALDTTQGRIMLIVTDAETWRTSSTRQWGPAVISEEASTMAAFGDRYMFSLDSRVQAPEWWVHKSTLVREAREAGLEIATDVNLATIATWLGVASLKSERRRKEWDAFHFPSLQVMCDSTFIHNDQWAVASLYRLYVLTKPRPEPLVVCQELQQWRDAHPAEAVPHRQSSLADLYVDEADTASFYSTHTITQETPRAFHTS